MFSWLLLLDSPDDVLAARSILMSPLYVDFQGQIIGKPKASIEEADADGDYEALRKFATELSADIRKQETSEWMRCLVDKCFLPVCASNRKASNDETMFVIVSRLLESWNAYAAALDRFGWRPDIRTFAGLSGLLSQQTSAPSLFPGSVGLYSCREAKGLSFPVVFVVGCSDLLFPSASYRQSLIAVEKLESLIAENWPDRKVSIYAARTAVELHREQHHFLYIALSRALRALHLTAPQNFGGEEFPAPCAPLEHTIDKSLRCSTPRGRSCAPAHPVCQSVDT